MLNRIRRLLDAQGAVASLTLAGLIGAFSAFTFWYLSAQRASISSVGHATTIVLVASVINAVTSFGFIVGLLRGQSLGFLTRRLVLSSVLFSAVGSIIASGLAAMFWSQDLLREIGISRSAIFFSLACLSGSLAISTIVDTLASSHESKMLAPVRNFSVLVMRVAIIVFISSPSLSQILFAFIAPLLASVVTSLPVYISKLDSGVAETSFPRILKDSFRAWPTSLVFSGVTLAVPLIVSLVVGSSRGAVFYLVWNIALLCNSIVSAATSIGLRERASAIQSRRLGIDVHIMVWCSGLATVVLGSATVMIFGSSYLELGLTAVPFIGLGLIPYGYLQYGALRLRRNGNDVGAAISTGCILLSMSVLLFWLQPKSLVFVAITWCISAVLSLVVLRAVSDRSTNG